MKKEEKKCIVSPLYGKDNDKNLHFYCDYCGKEIGYEENRICLAKRDKCPHCNSDIGDSEKSVDRCLTCESKI